MTTTRLLLDPSGGGRCGRPYGSSPPWKRPRAAIQSRNPTQTRQLRCALALLLPTRPSKNVVRSKPQANHARPTGLPSSTSFQKAHQQRRDVWVACMDHRQAICPTGPMSGAADSCGLPQTKPSQSQRERGGVSHPSVTNRPICPQNFREAIPHSLIMRFCKTCCC